MSIEAHKTDLDGVILVDRPRYDDDRGYFTEMYHLEKYQEAGIACEFVQDNVSYSRSKVLRGLHYQIKFPQAKLVSVLQGEVFDVAVDIRKGSPTFGKWVGYTLSAENSRQLFVPEGFAHGFFVTSESAVVHYKCNRLYQPNDDRGLKWSDPEIGIDWPGSDPVLSEKDQALPLLADLTEENTPIYS